MPGVTWIDAAPKFERHADGVRATYRSEDVVFYHQFSRADFRIAYECAGRLLAELEAEARVVAFPLSGVG